MVHDGSEPSDGAFCDPIVEEVRRARAKLWEQFDDDPKRVFEYLRKKSEEHPERMIDPDEFVRRFGTPAQRIPLSVPMAIDTRHVS